MFFRWNSRKFIIIDSCDLCVVAVWIIFSFYFLYFLSFLYICWGRLGFVSPRSCVLCCSDKDFWIVFHVCGPSLVGFSSFQVCPIFNDHVFLFCNACLAGFLSESFGLRYSGVLVYIFVWFHWLRVEYGVECLSSFLYRGLLFFLFFLLNAWSLTYGCCVNAC